MMGKGSRELSKHLTTDQIERLATGEPAKAQPVAAVAKHLRHCTTCHQEVTALATLHIQLRKLPYLSTRHGFTERVMARVTLPVPWYEQVWSTLRRRRVAVGVGFATAGSALGGVAYWLFGQQRLTPSEIFTFALEEIQAIGLRIAIAGGQVLYDSGVMDLLGTLIEQVALPEAAAAMALLSVTGFGALWTMKKLMVTDASRLLRVVKS